jgi:hypothetical protein
MAANTPLDFAPRPDEDGTRYTGAADPDATGCTPKPSGEPDADATRYHDTPTNPDATGHTLKCPDGVRRNRRALPCRFGDYELLEEVARGGMGVVYKARQQIGRGERIIALKVIQAGRLAAPGAVERFLQEARAGATLDHPGTVPIYDIGEVDGQHYFTMPLLTGGTLADRVRKGPLPPAVAARLVRQVAEAVQHAHERGVIHRDLKPANILLTGGGADPGPGSDEGPPCSGPSGDAAVWEGCTAKVTDFGLARMRESGLSVTGEVIGTPCYMPPEQARGEVRGTGPASDVYGLGAVLYCLLTGRPPFQSADPIETMRQVCQEDPVPPRQLNPQVPRDLETVCLKCLRKAPHRRYAAAREVAEELGRWERGEPVKARPLGRLERGWRYVRRRPGQAAWLAALALSLLAGTVVSTCFAIHARHETENARASAALATEKEKEAKRALEQLEAFHRLGMRSMSLPPGQKRNYEFQLKAHEAVWFAVMVRALPRGRDHDVELHIYDPMGRRIAVDEFPPPQAYVRFTPPATGVYRVEVRNSGSGTVQATLVRQLF